MSITVELSPELEARLRADAKQKGIAPETLVLETLSSYYKAPLSSVERRARVQSLKGRFAGAGPTVDDFLAERSAEGRKDAGL